MLPAGKGLGWHEDPATLEPQEIAASAEGGDVVVVKGSKKMFWVNKFVPRLAGRLAGKGVNCMRMALFPNPLATARSRVIFWLEVARLRLQTSDAQRRLPGQDGRVASRGIGQIECFTG